MKISIAVLFFLVCNFSLFAQGDSTAVSPRKIIYFNNFLAGGLFGEQSQGSGLSLLTTHGIRMNRWALGAGVGFDSYLDWKTIPVFGSMSFDFGKVKSNAFFLQFNAGHADAWRINKEDIYADYRQSGGKMISTLVGYRITKERFSLYMLAGHKFQQTHFSYNPEPWSSFAPQSSVYIEESINRLVVQIGFGLH